MDFDEELAYDAEGNAYAFSQLPHPHATYQRQQPLLLNGVRMLDECENPPITEEPLQEWLPTVRPFTRALSSLRAYLLPEQ